MSGSSKTTGTNPLVVSEMDVRHLAELRANVVAFMKRAAAMAGTTPGLLLDIAPQVHEGARPFFSEAIAVETLDIDPAAGCTYIGDICALYGDRKSVV